MPSSLCRFGLAAVLTLAAAPAMAAQCLDVTLPDTITVAGDDLTLNGMGIRKATMLSVKVYVAGLYVTEKSSDGEHIAGANQPWGLSMHFVRDVEASDIQDAFDESFEDVAGDNLAALSDRIDALKAQVTDIAEGQVLSYTYDPAVGTVVDVNGTLGAPIEGADFAKTLLLLTIGSEPPNKDLKTGLLGGACE